MLIYLSIYSFSKDLVALCVLGRHEVTLGSLNSSRSERQRAKYHYCVHVKQRSRLLGQAAGGVKVKGTDGFCGTEGGIAYLIRKGAQQAGSHKSQQSFLQMKGPASYAIVVRIAAIRFSP